LHTPFSSSGRGNFIPHLLTFCFIGHDFGGWWIGSILDVHTARSLCNSMSDLVGPIGPTALQVGCSLAAAVCWGIMNPNSGANFPEDLPSDFVVGIAKPWLGTWVSVRTDWKPTSDEIPRNPRSTDSSSSSDDSDSELSESSTSAETQNFRQMRSSPSWSHSRSGSTRVSPTSSSCVDEEWQFRNFVDFLEFQYGESLLVESMSPKKTTTAQFEKDLVQSLCT